MQTNVGPQVNQMFQAYRKRNVEEGKPKLDTGLLRKPEPKDTGGEGQDQPLRDVENVCKMIEARRKELKNATST